MEHTEEPWEVGVAGNGASGYIYCDDALGSAVATTCMEYTTISYEQKIANARRIVACVNACRGIPIEVLEDPEYSIKSELDSIDELYRLRKKAENNLADYRAEIETLNNRIRSLLAGSEVTE